MSLRALHLCLALWLVGPVAWAATLERARELFLSGERDSARTELQELLLDSSDETERASALELLGRLEVDDENWDAALEAWGALTDQYALSPQAAAVSAAIRPLQALVDCGCEPSDPGEVTASSEEMPAAPSPAPTPTPIPAPTTAPSPTTTLPPQPIPATVPGLLLVGGWGAEYDASQEVTRDLAEFLVANGVNARASSTEVPAIRGAEVVLSYLLEEAQQAGAERVLFLKTRFDFREYIELQAFDLNGNRLWREKISGGTALKERRDRGKPSWGLVERAKQWLSKRLGTPDLPTQE